MHSKTLIIGVFKLARIMDIYRRIECTPKRSFEQELCTSIRQLTTFQNLDLHNYSNLQKLPTFIGQLSALQNLHLWGYLKLQKLPIFVSQLSALQNLNFAQLFELTRITYIYLKNPSTNMIDVLQHNLH